MRASHRMPPLVPIATVCTMAVHIGFPGWVAVAGVQGGQLSGGALRMGHGLPTVGVCLLGMAPAAVVVVVVMVVIVCTPTQQGRGTHQCCQPSYVPHQ